MSNSPQTSPFPSSSHLTYLAQTLLSADLVRNILTFSDLSTLKKLRKLNSYFDYLVRPFLFQSLRIHKEVLYQAGEMVLHARGGHSGVPTIISSSSGRIRTPAVAGASSADKITRGKAQSIKTIGSKAIRWLDVIFPNVIVLSLEGHGAVQALRSLCQVLGGENPFPKVETMRLLDAPPGEEVVSRKEIRLPLNPRRLVMCASISCEIRFTGMPIRMDRSSIFESETENTDDIVPMDVDNDGGEGEDNNGFLTSTTSPILSQTSFTSPTLRLEELVITIDIFGIVPTDFLANLDIFSPRYGLDSSYLNIRRVTFLFSSFTNVPFIDHIAHSDSFNRDLMVLSHLIACGGFRSEMIKFNLVGVDRTMFDYYMEGDEARKAYIKKVEKDLKEKVDHNVREKIQQWQFMLAHSPHSLYHHHQPHHHDHLPPPGHNHHHYHHHHHHHSSSANANNISGGNPNHLDFDPMRGLTPEELVQAIQDQIGFMTYSECIRERGNWEMDDIVKSKQGKLRVLEELGLGRRTRGGPGSGEADSPSIGRVFVE